MPLLQGASPCASWELPCFQRLDHPSMVIMWLILVKIFPVITGGRNVSISVRTKYKDQAHSVCIDCCPAGMHPISIFWGTYTVWVLCMAVEMLLHSQADNPKQIRSLIAPCQHGFWNTIKLAWVLRFFSVAISQNLAKVAKHWRSKKGKRGRRWTSSLSHFSSNAYSASSVLHSHLCPRGNPRYHFPS